MYTVSPYVYMYTVGPYVYMYTVGPYVHIYAAGPYLYTNGRPIYVKRVVNLKIIVENIMEN